MQTFCNTLRISRRLKIHATCFALASLVSIASPEQSSAEDNQTDAGADALMLSVVPDAGQPTTADANKSPPPVAQEQNLPSSGELVVTVRGTAAKRMVAAGDYNIKIGQLADVPRRSAAEMLTLAPGIMLTNHGGEGHASGVFLRGFDAGEGQDLEFSLEGVPINETSNPHGHGYADANFIIPELVSELRVVEGPFDPRQGDFAAAGSVRYTLGMDRKGLVAKIASGSFDRRRVLLLWSPQAGSKGNFVGMDLSAGNGFGPNRAFAAARMMARHELKVTDHIRMSLLATSYATRFDSAGVIRLDDYRAERLPCGASTNEQFFCLYDTNQGGAASRHSMALTLERRDGAETNSAMVFVTYRPLRLRENFTGYLTDINPNGLPQRGDGFEQNYDALTIGSQGSQRVTGQGWVREWEVGYFVRHDQISSAQHRLRTEDRAPYKVDLDARLRITNIAPYLALTVSPFSRLTLSGGLRADAFLFGVTDENRPASDRQGTRLPYDSAEAYGLAIQPKLSGNFRATPELHLLLSAGVGTRSSFGQALSDGEYAPFAKVTASETGVAFTRVAHRAPGGPVSLDARLIAFWTQINRDLVFDEVAGRNTLAGRSNRIGSLASLRATSRVGLDALLSATYSEAYLPPTGTGLFDIKAGDRIPYIPRWVLRSDVSFRRHTEVHSEQVSLTTAFGFTYVAPRPLPYGQLSPAIATLDVAARVSIRNIEIGISATNLLDRRNREAVFNYISNFRGPTEAVSMLPQQHFAAGPPRQFLLTLQVAFDGKDNHE